MIDRYYVALEARGFVIVDSHSGRAIEGPFAQRFVATRRNRELNDTPK